MERGEDAEPRHRRRIEVAAPARPGKASPDEWLAEDLLHARADVGEVMLEQVDALGTAATVRLRLSPKPLGVRATESRGRCAVSHGA